MRNLNQIFRYEGSSITFQKGDSIMVNATEMAKQFGRTPKDWLRTEYTQAVIRTLSAVRQISPTELVKVVQGGAPNLQGTWMHEDVAMEFARWLSPAFAIWCNDRIKELLTTGVTTVANDDEVIMQAMTVLKKRLDESKQRVQMLEGQTEIQREQIKDLAPKAQYTDEVLQSTSTYTLTQVAHDLGLRSVHVLTDILKRKGLLYRQSNQWQPTAKVADKSFFATRTAKYIKKDNTIGSSISTVVTERGWVFIHNLIRKESVL